MLAVPPKAEVKSGIGIRLDGRSWSYEWVAIKPFLPNKPRGVRRVNDRRVLNGIFWVLRSGAPWRDLPAAYGPRTTCYNRFVRWRRAGHGRTFRQNEIA